MLLADRTLFRRVAVALPVALAAAFLCDDGASLAQASLLKAPLILEDLQSGFVGQTGTIWTIAPDRSFTVARRVGPKSADPHKQGRLTADQQQRLITVLAGIELATLPEQLGGVPQANAHQIVLSYGSTRCVLTLPPAGGAPDPQADRRIAWVRELRDTLKDMIGS